MSYLMGILKKTAYFLIGLHHYFESTKILITFVNKPINA